MKKLGTERTMPGTGRIALSTKTKPTQEAIRNAWGTRSVCQRARRAANHVTLSRGGVMERLSALDATFLYFETPAQHQHVCAVMVVDPSTVPGGYTYQKIKDHIASR